MLLRYATFLSNSANEVKHGPIDTQLVRLIFVKVRGLFWKTVEGATPYIADVLVEHTSSQNLTHLFGRMAECGTKIDEPRENRIVTKYHKVIS